MKPKHTLRSFLLAAVFTASATLHAAPPVIDEPFADSNSSLTGNTAGTGLTGNWTASTTFVVPSGSASWGKLAFSGNRVTYSGNAANSAASAVIDGATLGTLIDDGSTLWFSMIVDTPDTAGSNPDTGFAIGTSTLGSGNGLPMGGSGSGIGWAITSGALRAATWVSGAKGASTGSGIAVSTRVLIVGEIIWGATDTINLYLPDANLNLGSIVQTRAVALTQSGFGTISFGMKSNTGFGFDEIRFGASSADVLPVDTVPPTLLSITDDKAGGPIGEDVSIVTYTLTFDRPMDISTITDTDFDNAGSATATVGSVTQVSPTVITVQLLPTTTGTLQLRIPATSVLSSFVPLDLNTTSAILDDTTITINAGTTLPSTPTSNRWWDGATTSGVTDGVSQGGTATWDNGTTTNWDRGAGFEAPVAWNNSDSLTAIFGGTAGTVTLDGNITLDGLTVSLPNAGGSGYSIGNVGEDSTLTFTGGKTVTTTATGTNTNQDVTIYAGIAGSPTLNIAGRADNNANTFSLLPTSNVTMTLGTVNMLNTNSSNKRLILGGESTGNVADAVIWPTVAQQLFLTKAGTGSWTINNDVLGSGKSGRLYVEQGTLTLSGTSNFFTHKVGVSTVRASSPHSASNLASKLVAKGTFTINDNREWFYVQNVGTLSPGPGVETLNVTWNANSSTSVNNGAFNMQTGSTYEWSVASSASTDVVNVTTGGSNNGNLILGNMTLKITDAGAATAIANTDQLTLFTYETGAQTVARSIGTISFDTSALGAGWTVGSLAVTDDGAGTIYLTGLSFTPGGGSPYDTWATGGELFDEDANGDGVSNGLAFLLGAADPDANALGLLPEVTESGGGLVMTFTCLDDASRGTATLYVDHSSDLNITDPWESSLAVDDDGSALTNGVTLGVVVNPGDADLNDVTATISSSEAAAGKLFGRLRAENP